MPAAQVELDDANEPLGRVVNLGDGQEHLGMAHEAGGKSWSAGTGLMVVAAHGRARAWWGRGSKKTDFVILSSMLLGSRMKVGRVTLLRSAPGRSWEMMCVRTAQTC